MTNEDKEIVKDMWVSYTEQAGDITNKRYSMNGLYLSIETALFGFSVGSSKIFGIMMAAAGIILSIVWALMIFSFRALNNAKYKVVNEMEKELPIKPYEEEWKVKKKYISLTVLEIITSALFFVGFLTVLILKVCEVL